MKPIKQLHNKNIEEKACIGETLVHIHNIQYYLNILVKNILDRSQMHDRSKLDLPELNTFVAYTPKLKNMVYGSEEYKQCLTDMKPALDNHYANNSHHPEHYTNGIADMSLIDLLEMVIDWKASSLRGKDGDINKSLIIQKDRFNIDDQLYNVLLNTIKELQLDK